EGLLPMVRIDGRRKAPPRNQSHAWFTTMKGHCRGLGAARATSRSAVDRCPANLEHSPAEAPLDCAWPGASAGGGTLQRHKIGPDDAGTAMYAPFMVVNHAWRRLLAQGGDPKSTAFPSRGRVGERGKEERGRRE